MRPFYEYIVMSRTLDIIKEHKLLNYILKNEKCANMYNLSEEEIETLKEFIKLK